MVRRPICVCGVGWSDAVTKWHLMREDDDHEFEIVITRSHSLLCFLTASWIINQYFNVNWAGSITEIHTDYVYCIYMLGCESEGYQCVTIWLHRQCNNRWCRVQLSHVWYISDSTDTEHSMSAESQVPQDHRTTVLLLLTNIAAGLFI